MKENKGITLVALIITIIVLLILAVVTISAISGERILQHAENAENRYSNAAAKEQTQINEYENYLDQRVSTSKSKITNLMRDTNGTIDTDTASDESTLYQYNFTGEIASIQLNGKNYFDLANGRIIMGTKDGRIIKTTTSMYDTYKIAFNRNPIEKLSILKVAAEPSDTDMSEIASIPITITFKDGTVINDVGEFKMMPIV